MPGTLKSEQRLSRAGGSADEVINIASGAKLQIDNSGASGGTAGFGGAITNLSGGTVSINASSSGSASATLSLSGALSNAGTIAVTAGDVVLFHSGGNIGLGGTINVTGGTLAGSSGELGANTATVAINVSSGAVLDIDNASSGATGPATSFSGTISNSGTVSIMRWVRRSRPAPS